MSELRGHWRIRRTRWGARSIILEWRSRLLLWCTLHDSMERGSQMCSMRVSEVVGQSEVQNQTRRLEAFGSQPSGSRLTGSDDTGS